MSSDGSDLRQRYADLVTRWFEPGERLAHLSELLAVRDGELAELREQVAFEKHRAATYLGDYNFLDFQHKAQSRELEAWRERAEKAEAAVARVREAHARDDSNPLGPWCGICETTWPCFTLAALDDQEDGSRQRKDDT